jgi:hypothetical protein
MKKEFVDYNLASRMKALGFDEPCFGYYYTLNGRDWKFAEKTEYLRLDDEINIGPNFNILAPTYLQTFRWFRENYDMIHNIDRIFKDEFGYTITPGDNEPINGFCFNSYEEAELACIEKMIEIVESNLVSNQLYSEIETLIMMWNNDGTKTAGSLTRNIMKVINQNELL